MLKLLIMCKSMALEHAEVNEIDNRGSPWPM